MGDNLNGRASPDDINAIINWFGGGYLLALRNFITYVNQNEVSISEYLQMVRERAEILNVDDMGYKYTVITAIQANIAKATESNKQHLNNILHVFRFLNSK